MRLKSDLLPIIEASEQRPTNGMRSIPRVGTLLGQVFWKFLDWGKLSRPAFYIVLAILVVIAASACAKAYPELLSNHTTQSQTPEAIME